MVIRFANPLSRRTILALEDTLKQDIAALFDEKWEQRDGQKVPEPSDLRLGNDAVKLDATILYADLVESTDLVDQHTWWFAGEVYKAFLHCAAKIIKTNEGTIVSYDGDRIMAVFLGGSKNSQAVNSALCLSGAVKKIINPELLEHYKGRTTFKGLRHAVGIDNGVIHAARTGVRGDNDIVWIGKAANHAAKLCTLRDGTYSTFITADVYNNMSDKQKLSESRPGTNMWDKDYWIERQRTIYKSSWFRYGF